MPRSRPALAALCTALLLAACSSTLPQSGFLGDYSQLKPHPDFPKQLRYIREGFDVAPYRALMIDPVQIQPYSVEIEREATPEKLAWLADEFHQALVTNAGEHYRIVSRPGRDVLRVRTALTDVEPSSHGSDEGTTSQGQVTVEVEIVDAGTGERLAAAVLRQTEVPDDLGSFTRWGQASEAFKYWGERLVIFLAENNSEKQAPEDEPPAEEEPAEEKPAEGSGS